MISSFYMLLLKLLIAPSSLKKTIKSLTVYDSWAFYESCDGF